MGVKKRRKQVTEWVGENFTLRVGRIVKWEWGGTVEGQRPRTKRGTITKLMCDGGFAATCEKTGRTNYGSASNVIEVIR